MPGDIKPYIVKYKAKRDSDIKPGIHGKFETEEEARRQVLIAREFFDRAFGRPDAAHVGIVVDKGALLQLKETEDAVPTDDDTTLESGPIEAVPFLVEILESEHSIGREDAEELVTRHAKIVVKKAVMPLSLKVLRGIADDIMKAEVEQKEANDERALLKAEVARLREELEKKKSKKKEQETADVP